MFPSLKTHDKHDDPPVDSSEKLPAARFLYYLFKFPTEKVESKLCTYRRLERLSLSLSLSFSPSHFTVSLTDQQSPHR